MFTGLIQDLGTLTDTRPGRETVVFEIRSGLSVDDFELGESIAVNGVCLTVTSILEGAFRVDVGPETLDVTTLGRLRPGERVHLERALRVDERLGGHMVLGHVDAVGTMIGNDEEGDAWQLRIRIPRPLLPEIVEKGSIAIEGVSLTVNAIDDDVIRITIIPHTATETLLVRRNVGDAVNVETDILGKHVRRLLSFDNGTERMEATLRKYGYLQDGER